MSGVRVGAKRGPDGPSEEQQLRAWEMRVAGSSNAAIAEKFEISVTTAKRWVRAGRELAEVVDYTDRIIDPAKRIDLEVEQARQLATVDMVIAWMGGYIERGGEEDKAATVVLKALERRAAATGSDPPRRLAVRDDRGSGPDAAATVNARIRAGIAAYGRGEDPVDYDEDGGAEDDGHDR